MKKFLLAIATATLLTTGCQRDAQVASHNLSKAADMFEIDRRVVFYNGITEQYILTIEGKCSIKDAQGQLEVTCKTGSNEFRKHFLGLSDNVTYFAEQIDGVGVSTYHNRIIWKPQSIIPNIDINVDTQDTIETLSK